MKIDNILLDNLTAQAKESPRLRMNLDLRNSADDSSQRMLNAIEPGSVVPVHRHPKTSETVVLLRGRAVQELYGDDGVCVASIDLCACGEARAVSDSADAVYAMNIPAGQWHTLRALESGTVILEMKDGPYEPLQECDILKV